MFNINDKVRIKNSSETWNNKEGIILEEYVNIYLVQVDFNGNKVNQLFEENQLDKIEN